MGRVGPALYGSTNASDFTDITSGNNDFTDTNGGVFTATTGKNASDATTGLGSPVDPNLALALQGGDGCPSVAALSPNTGPLSGSDAVTIFGGSFANATSVTFGSAGHRDDRRPHGHDPHGDPADEHAWCASASTSAWPIPRVSRPARPLPSTATAATSTARQGYTFVASDGGIFDYGSAGFFGSWAASR